MHSIRFQLLINSTDFQGASTPLPANRFVEFDWEGPQGLISLVSCNFFHTAWDACPKVLPEVSGT